MSILGQAPGTAFRLLFTSLAFTAVGTAAAAENTITLQHNPFNKPQTLAAPPPKVVTNKAHHTPDVLPRLSAILLSDSLPMVIADDELLSPGEEINGYHLLSVENRGAVFEKQGKKYIIVLEDDQAKTDQAETKQRKNIGATGQSGRRPLLKRQSTRRK